MIDRYLVRYFLAVVDHGNFSRAALHCHVSQPTLSTGIAKLERELGKRLIERNSRRVSLTEAGSTFAAHARRIEAEFLEAEVTTKAVSALPIVRLGVAITISPEILTAALDVAMDPTKRLELVEGRSRELDNMLHRGRVDAILTIASKSSLPTKPVVEEGYSMAFPVRHPLSVKSDVSPEELADQVMLVRRHCEALPEISRFFTSRGIRPRMAARTSSDAHALAYVRAGLGITMVPESFASKGISLARVTGFDLRRHIVIQCQREQAWMLDQESNISKFADALTVQFNDVISAELT